MRWRRIWTCELHHVSKLAISAPRVEAQESLVQRQILAPDAVVPAKMSRVPLTEAILELVRANLGVSILARWVVAPQIGRGRRPSSRCARRTT